MLIQTFTCSNTEGDFYALKFGMQSNNKLEKRRTITRPTSRRTKRTRRKNREEYNTIGNCNTFSTKVHRGEERGGKGVLTYL